MDNLLYFQYKDFYTLPTENLIKTKIKARFELRILAITKIFVV